jgi:hypothetical protein
MEVRNRRKKNEKNEILWKNLRDFFDWDFFDEFS